MKTVRVEGKRLLSLILSLVLLFSFISCDKGGALTGDTGSLDAFDYSAIPAFSGEAYVTVNKNTPFFTDDEITTDEYEKYFSRDRLDRCTMAMASLHVSLMPTGEREDISSVKPTGWNQQTYDCISGGYLYNRCHLIGYQLSGENALKTNLITGTRYMNEAMIPFENMVAAYLKETENHVMYRVTPIFLGDDLLARGVLLEAYSVEDEGEGICFNVFFYNVQPGVVLDYATGASRGEEESDSALELESIYIINKGNGKIHKSSCSYALQISESRRMYTSKSVESLEKEGYVKASCCLGDK